MSLILIGAAGALIATIIWFFVGPILEGPRNKFLALIRKKPEKKTRDEIRKQKDLKLLEETKSPLRFINQLPQYPSNTFREDVRAKLNEIREIADQVKYKEFQEIKQKLIDYSDKVNQLNQNILLNKTIKLLVKDESGNHLAMELIKEIDENISQNK